MLSRTADARYERAMSDGAPPTLRIRPFHPDDEDAVVTLWGRCELLRPWNDPHKDIQRKLKVRPDLFLVGECDNGPPEQPRGIVAAVMAGYEGHRGWMNYLAVDPRLQRNGFGRDLVAEVERLLLAEGCPKINIQVRNTNTHVVEFYQRLGYHIDESISMGKRLEHDE